MVQDKNGEPLARDAVTFKLAGQTLSGIALARAGPYVTVLYAGVEFGITPERIQKVAPDPGSTEPGAQRGKAQPG